MAKRPNNGGIPRLEPGARSVAFGIAISATQAARLEQVVGDRRARSAIIRQALDEFLDRHYPDTRTSSGTVT